MAKASHVADDRQFVESLARGFRILACFSADRPALSCSELARMTGLPQPTTWRLCHTMLKVGVLDMLDGERLRPGLPALRLGHSAVVGLGVVELARPHLQKLADDIGGASGIGSRDGSDMVYLQRCESESPLLMKLKTGSRIPIASSAMGWGLLAGLEDAERAKLTAAWKKKKDETWLHAEKDFRKALVNYRTHGWIINIDTFQRGYSTAAVPVKSKSGKVLYALNCGAISAILPASKIQTDVAPRLVEIARLIEQSL